MNIFRAIADFWSYLGYIAWSITRFPEIPVQSLAAWRKASR